MPTIAVDCPSLVIIFALLLLARQRRPVSPDVVVPKDYWIMATSAFIPQLVNVWIQLRTRSTNLKSHGRKAVRLVPVSTTR